MLRFNHFNFNVCSIARSLDFYEKALDLRPVRAKEGPDGSFRLVFLGDRVSDFSLELTEVRGRTEPYDLGECEFHLAFVTDDFDGMYARHKEMGCICFENRDMGVYFIQDPDGYWIEIVPQRS